MLSSYSSSLLLFVFSGLLVSRSMLQVSHYLSLLYGSCYRSFSLSFLSDFLCFYCGVLVSSFVSSGVIEHRSLSAFKPRVLACPEQLNKESRLIY